MRHLTEIAEPSRPAADPAPRARPEFRQDDGEVAAVPHRGPARRPRIPSRRSPPTVGAPSRGLPQPPRGDARGWLGAMHASWKTPNRTLGSGLLAAKMGDSSGRSLGSGRRSSGNSPGRRSRIEHAIIEIVSGQWYDQIDWNDCAKRPYPAPIPHFLRFSCRGQEPWKEVVRCLALLVL